VTNSWINGIDHDYPDIDLPLGFVQCARSDHGLQESVDHVTGETHGIWIEVMGMMGRTERVRVWRGGSPPACAGMCQSCWMQMGDPNYAHCPLHGSERKVVGVEGCPICGLDVREKKKCADLVAKMAEIDAIRVPDAEDLGDPDPPPPLYAGVVTQTMMREALRQRAGR